MYACQNRIDGAYLTIHGFSGGNTQAWSNNSPATFDTKAEAEKHAKECGVRDVVRIVEIDD